MNPFGMYLTTLRLKHRFKQKDLAEALDVYSSYISEIESGRRNPPSSKVIDAIAYAMSLSRDEVAQLNGYAEQSIKVFHVPGLSIQRSMAIVADVAGLLEGWRRGGRLPLSGVINGYHLLW